MTDATENAELQARAQVASIVAMVAALDVDYERLEELREEIASCCTASAHGLERESALNRELAELEEVAGENTSEDDARERILEDALSVEVRSDWESNASEFTACEFRILLCTGGPHVEIVGELDNGSPSRVRVIYKDWGTSGELFDFDRDAVVRYCSEFYFGE